MKNSVNVNEMSIEEKETFFCEHTADDFRAEEIEMMAEMMGMHAVGSSSKEKYGYITGCVSKVSSMLNVVKNAF